MNLPDVIYLEVLYYLTYRDQISFVLSSSTLWNRLIQRIKVIDLPERDDFTLYLISQAYRDKVHKLICYDQLKLIIPEDDWRIDSDFTINCSYLRTTTNVFHQFLSNDFILKIKNLELIYRSNEEDLEDIVQWIDDNPSISLKTLKLKNFPPIWLPNMPMLESLTLYKCLDFDINHLEISAYTNLRCLILYKSDCLIDVRRLDGIYELHLILCDKINDISTLNHNQKINIELCRNIFNYSNCLRYSKSVTIGIGNWNDREINLDLTSLHEVKELIISVQLVKSNQINLLFPSCKSLRSIEVKNFPFPFSLPPQNNVRSITIVNCAALTALLNFEKIRFVNLSHLHIKSLDGLGSDVLEVEIINCPFIEDFSILKKCKKVRIRGSPKEFELGTQLSGVKDFTLYPGILAPTEMLIQDCFEGVTCLSFDDIPDNLPSLKFVSRLEFRAGFDDDSSVLQPFLNFIANIPSQVNHIRLFVEGELYLILKEKRVVISDFNAQIVQDGVIYLRK